MNVRYTSAWTESLKAEGKAEGRVVGRAKGLAIGLLKVMGHRGIAVSDQAREHILNCEDPDQVSAWATKVFESTLTNADQLFDE